MDISENSLKEFPINCAACNALLYGKVKFCPYCSKSTSVSIEDNLVITSTPSLQDQGEPIPSAQVVEDKSRGIEIADKPHLPSNKTTAASDIIENSILESKPPAERTVVGTEKKKGKYTKSGLPWWLIALVLGIVFITSYYIIYSGQKKNKDDILLPMSSPQSMPSAGKRDSARIQALDTLRAGTDLSVRITSIPKMEEVLRAAQKLQIISPRYQDNVTSAAANLETIRKDRDKKHLSYIGLLSELSRFSPDDLSYTLSMIKNSDLTSREKKVLDLLSSHLIAARNNKKIRPEKILLDFNRVFDDFVE